MDGIREDCTASERRTRFLADAVNNLLDRSPDSRSFGNVSTLKLLIRLMGSSYRPYSFDADSDYGTLVTQEINSADWVNSLMEKLATTPSDSASNALEELASDKKLLPWRSRLRDAMYRQRVVRREAEFTYREVSQVFDTLDNGPPANAADLATIAFDNLRQIARNIRDGNTSDWRQYWNVDKYNHPEKPRPENSCRDSLLSDLKNKLEPLGIDASPEGTYAEDNSADIRVSCGRYNLPIEIKRSCSRDLWSAVQSQLISRYSKDPGTDGHGIYLVFWFGNTEQCRPTLPETGSRPFDSSELECRLKSTLSAEEELKIKICVIDVASPDSTQHQV